MIDRLRKELKSNLDRKYKEGSIRFFREPIKTHGVRTPVLKQIANKYFKEIKELDKKEIFKLCEELLESGYIDEINIAFWWVGKIQKRLEKSDFKIFEKWVKTYITNWANCDTFCTQALGHFLLDFPEFVPNVKKWTKSNNRWVKRASAVVYIYGVKRGRFLKDIFETADLLIKDEDDMVQKGYGWSLKVAGDVFRKEVNTYMLSRKYMPRIALRYAIEKYPQDMRTKIMK
jgi:3-methyladenine DNA glycosylase AlkD